MVKHTQTIRPQIADELFECVWRFCGVGALRVKIFGCFNLSSFIYLKLTRY